MSGYKEPISQCNNEDIKEDSSYYEFDLVTSICELLEYDIYKLFSISNTFQNSIEISTPIKSKYGSVIPNYNTEHECVEFLLRSRYVIPKIPSIYEDYSEFLRAFDKQYAKYISNTITNNNFNLLNDIKNPMFISSMGCNGPISTYLYIGLDKNKIRNKLSVFMNKHDAKYDAIFKYISDITLSINIEFFGEKKRCTIVHNILIFTPIRTPHLTAQFTDAFLKMTCGVRNRINDEFNLTPNDNYIAN